MFYINFQTNFEYSIQELIDFLELKRIHKPLPFTFGENIHYFTLQQRVHIEKFTRILSSNETWNYLKHYFHDIDNAHDNQNYGYHNGHRHHHTSMSLDDV